MNNKNNLVISYLELRRTIGALGMGLPLILAGGAWLVFSIGLQDSISSYYHTPMRDVFVGLVFFLSGFFWAYKGYDWRDALAGKLATLFGWLFAIVPQATSLAQFDLNGRYHFIFAAAFFAILIYFSGYLFTRTHSDKPPTPQKKLRNLVYRICAVVMGVALAVGITLYFFPTYAAYHPLFWGETLAIEAFGLSWFVKGAGLLSDEEQPE